MSSEFFVDSNEVGDNLSLYTGLTPISAESLEELALKLKSIKFPYKIVFNGNNANMTRFYVMINASRPVKIKKVNKQ